MDSARRSLGASNLPDQWKGRGCAEERRPSSVSMVVFCATDASKKGNFSKIKFATAFYEIAFAKLIWLLEKKESQNKINFRINNVNF